MNIRMLYKNINKLLIMSIFLGIIIGATSFDLQIVNGSIDAAYIYTYNTLITNPERFAELALTYGPLGFIVHVIDIGTLKAVSILIHSLAGGITGYLVYLLVVSLKTHQKYVLSAMGVYIVCIQVFEWKIFCMYILLSLIFYRTKNRKLAYILVLACVILIYIKVTLGIAAGVVLLASLLLLKTKLSEYIKLGVIGGISVIILGVVLFRSFNLAESYIINSLAIGSGYSSAMALQPSNWAEVLIYVVVGIALTFLSMYLLTPKDKKSYLLVLAIASFFVWKSAIVRQDPYGHIETIFFFFVFLSFIGFFLSLTVKIQDYKKNLSSLGIGLIGLTFILVGVHYNGFTFTRLSSTLTNPLSFWKVEDCVLAPCTKQEGLYLGDDIKKKIGRQTVDMYPWQNLYGYSNNLNWRPRPSPASYGTYTPHLDTLNAQFLASNRSPEYVIWDIHEGVFSIDGRHILFDEPKTMKELLMRYSPVTIKEDKIVLLEKDKHVITSNDSTYKQSKKMAWNQWVQIPQDNCVDSTVAIEYIPDNLQKVSELVFRPHPVSIEVEKFSGKRMAFRLLTSNASQGLLMCNLPTDNRELVQVIAGRQLKDTVKRVRILGVPSGILSVRY